MEKLLAKNFTSSKLPAVMDRDEQHADVRDRPAGKAALAAVGLGVQFAASLVAFYYLGQWLDRRLGTAPVFLLGCVLLGSGTAFYVMYRQLMGAQRRETAARAAARARESRQ